MVYSMVCLIFLFHNPKPPKSKWQQGKRKTPVRCFQEPVSFTATMAQSGSANAIGSVSGDSLFSWQNVLVSLGCNWKGYDRNLFSKNYEVPFSGNIEITATPEGDNTDLVKGHCKRITFSYTFPERARYYVAHIAMNGVHDRGKYVTWCGLFVKEVSLPY